MSGHAILSGVIGGVVGWWCLHRALHRPGKDIVDADGWHDLRPNALFAVTLAVSLLIVAGCTAVLLTGRYNADKPGETTALLCLIGGFGIGAAVIWWQGFARRLRWRGDVLRVSSFGRIEDHAFASLRHIALREAHYDMRLTFVQGRVTVSLLASGVRELIAHLYDLRPDLFPDDDEDD